MFQKLIIYLAVLNICDGIITWYGLKFEYITEANPMMNELYMYSPYLFLVVKAGLSIFLLLIISLLHRPKTKILKGLTAVAAITYTYTMILHSLWLVQV